MLLRHASPSYAPLWCKSAYSFLEGASHPDELIAEAHRLGIRTLALTDRDGVYGVVRAYKPALESGVQLIVGSEITLDDRSTIVLLSASRRGYANLCRLISTGRLRSPKGTSAVRWEEVCGHAEGLIALWGGAQGLLAGEAEPCASGDLRDAFGDRLYAMLTRHREEREVREEARLRERARRYGIPTVACMEVLYHTQARRPLQDVMTCIRHGTTLSNAGRLLRANAEHALRSAHGFAKLYEDDVPSILRTLEIAERCTFSLSELRYRYPSDRLPDGTTSADWLRRQTHEGARGRYPEGVPREVIQQIEKELALIQELEYEGYFLTMWELVQFCRHKNILCQGRGSAANSVVCYCLGITAIDPVRMGLLFERFLSRERAEPPDIDLDIEHNRREEVIQHLYQRHGRTHAAMVANFVRYRARSALRDVGKALGLQETALERLGRLTDHYSFPGPEATEDAGFNPQNRLHGLLLELTRQIQGMPRHLSIHPGGFLLGQERVDELAPIENATMPDRTVVQWDKDDLEDLGLFKVDLLGLGALNVVHQTFDLIERHYGEKLSLATIPPDDPSTYEMIRQADTIGVFQIESRAQMSMLPRLKPKNYYDLVIEVSIVRPGPISGGMVHPYLRRRNGEEEIVYPHEILRPVLEKTLGIPLFQEQVMQLAIVAADYTPGEADQLRKDMAAWKSTGRIDRHRARLTSRMMEKGITQEFAERVYKQILGFGEYGFPESHAASFALIAYATSWLKCHYAAAFLCGMLNAQPMGFYSQATLIQDAQHHGVIVLPIDVQRSAWDCTLETHGGGFAVRMGFRYVKGLGEDNAGLIVAQRIMAPFGSVNDLMLRTELGEIALRRLAESGALECFQTDRRDVLWRVLGAEHDVRDGLGMHEEATQASFARLSFSEILEWDYASTLHSTRGHPVESIRDELSRRGFPDAKEVRSKKNGDRINYAGLVICRQHPGTAKGVTFITLEDESGFVNLVLWKKIFERYELLARTQSLLGVTGKLQHESGVIHLVVEKLWDPQIPSWPFDTKSRDFH